METKKTLLARIIDNEDVYTTVRAQRIYLMQEMQRAGVRFAHIEQWCLKQAKIEGIWNKKEDGSLMSEDLIRSFDFAWYRQIKIFVRWVNNNFSSYTEEKKKSEVNLEKEEEKKLEEKKKREEMLKGMTDQEKEEMKEKEKREREQLAEYKAAQFLTKNKEVFLSIAAKEQKKEEVSAFITLVESALKHNRIIPPTKKA